MRERQAAKIARGFVEQKYPAYADCPIGVVQEQDGARRKSWAFSVHVDEEDADYERGESGPVGYVHEDGYVEGLYGANR